LYHRRAQECCALYNIGQFRKGQYSPGASNDGIELADLMVDQQAIAKFDPDPNMPSDSEPLARRIVHDLMIYTRGRPRQFVSIQTIERRLDLTDDETTDAALNVAMEQGWLLRKGESSFGLTDAGRKVAKV
jgi:hypothetical protein